MDVQALGTAIERSDACEIARINWDDKRENDRRYQALIYYTSCAFVVFLLGAIVLTALGGDTRGAGLVSFVGTVASGAGMAFVLKRKKEVAAELKAASKLVKENCSEERVRQLLG